MAINWRIYSRVKSFKVLEAAFLWLEIEPSEKLINSPTHEIRTMQQVLSDALNDVVGDEFIQKAQEAAQKQGISKVDVLKRLFAKPPNPPRRKTIIPNQFLPQAEYGPREMAYEIVSLYGIDSDCLTEESWEDLARQWRTNTNLERVVSKAHLIKVAEAWNETPKFLFTEVSDGARWNKEGTITKESYQKLVLVLLKELNVDPTTSEAGGQIHRKVQESGSDLSLRTIQKILNEIEPSRQKKRR